MTDLPTREEMEAARLELEEALREADEELVDLVECRPGPICGSRFAYGREVLRCEAIPGHPGHHRSRYIRPEDDEKTTIWWGDDEALPSPEAVETLVEEAWTTVRIREEVGDLAWEVSVGNREPVVARTLALRILRLLSLENESPEA